MRKQIPIVLTTLVALALLTVPACKRTDVNDPGMIANDSYQINLSGTADPSTLYLYIGCDVQTSKLTLNAKFNNGEPVKNREIFLIIEEVPTSSGSTRIGYFQGKKSTISITTNESGISYAYYYVDRTDRERIVLETNVYIRAYIESDLYPKVYEIIKIRVVSDYQG